MKNVQYLLMLCLLVLNLYKCNSQSCTNVVGAYPFVYSNETVTALSHTDCIIYGIGYKSNYGQLSQLITYEIAARGTKSAQYASLISGEYEVRCEGYKSCANSESLISKQGLIFCGGVGSCAYSDISCPVTSDTSAVGDYYGLSCDAEMSCAFAFIRNTTIVVGFGPFSLYSAIIDSTWYINNDIGSATVITFRGHSAGYNSTIYNYNSDSAYATIIQCDGNGCTNVKLMCNDTQCSNFVVTDCDPNNGTTCPIYVYQADDEINSDETDEFMTTLDILDIGDQLNDICDLYDEYCFDNYIESRYSSVESDDSGICCRGQNSCSDSSLINANGNNNNAKNNANNNVTNFGLRSVICSARSSCRNGDDIVLTNTKYGNVFCLAPWSCEDSTITMPSFSDESGNNTDTGNLELSEFLSYGHTVYCGGYFSCGSSTITNATNVFCQSSFACNNSNIYNVSNVYFSVGSDPFNNANTKINSGSAGTQLSVYFNSFGSGAGVNVYCAEYAVCYIYCKSQFACISGDGEYDGSVDFYYPTTIYCSQSTNNCIVDCFNKDECPEITYVDNVIPSTTSITSTKSTTSTTALTTMLATTTSATTLATTSTTRPATTMLTTTELTTQKPLTTTSTTFASTSDESNDDNADPRKLQSKQWKSVGLWIIRISWIFGVIVMCMVGLWHNGVVSVAADRPNYLVIVKCANNFADFWTDFTFCGILYLDEDVNTTLFWLSVCFFIVPFAVQLVACFYWIKQWKESEEDQSNRLKNYLQSYQGFIWFLTIFLGFYSGIDLIQSKIFYKEMFYFSLKSYEYSKLKCWRFLNIVILENIPQLCVQLTYVIYYNTNESVILFSITFSILSILFSLVTQISRVEEDCCKCTCPCVSNNFVSISKLRWCLHIEDKNLQSYHCFSHELIEKAVCSVLETNEDFKGIKYDVEAFYIRDRILESKQIHVYLEIRIKSTSHAQTMYHSSVLENMQREIEDLGKRGTSSNVQFNKAVSGTLSLTNVFNIKVCDLELERSNTLTTRKKNESQMAIIHKTQMIADTTPDIL